MTSRNNAGNDDMFATALHRKLKRHLKATVAMAGVLGLAMVLVLVACDVSPWGVGGYGLYRTARMPTFSASFFCIVGSFFLLVFPLVQRSATGTRYSEPVSQLGWRRLDFFF